MFVVHAIHPSPVAAALAAVQSGGAQLRHSPLRCLRPLALRMEGQREREREREMASETCGKEEWAVHMDL